MVSNFAAGFFYLNQRRFMQLLEKRILTDGNILGENILKVDNF
ncbi:hypothetical protein SDD27957_04655 [Streptococcus dysgalactiae subsp. dysgalactiae ATCC 27957]|nr:hypothetical protein SDD27957_04655 [Streptococcus dysgalactiae subsp. dysgalactiae ATCC 27957]